jgi:pimeloyl-ACP methyl ester carboxylesterase
VKTEHRIRLRDGRHLGAVEHGAGAPLVWLTGTPGSRLWRPPRPLDGVRLIVVERPGFGLSDPRPGRAILDWPDDLAQAADGLGLDRFALAGTSGAGPYLYACGRALPERVRAIAAIGCFTPFSDGLSAFRRAALAVARHAPSAIAPLLPRDPEAFYRRLVADAPPCDRAILARPEVWAGQVAMTAEALRQGPRAFVEELSLGARPWGFSLDEVRVEVRLWHGVEDAACPAAAARRAAAALPQCRARFLDGAGHFLHFDRWREIVEDILSS